VESLLAQIETVSAPSVAAFTLIALMGLIIGLAPSSLPLVSVVVGTVASQKERPRAGRKRSLLFSGSFVCGIATADALLGAVFRLIDLQALQFLSASLTLTNGMIAAVLAVISLALLRIIYVPGPLRGLARDRQTSSLGGAFLLGIPFGLSTCPACTPLV